MLQLKVPPVGENESSELEDDGDEEEADEGEEEEGSLPVNSAAAKEREADLGEGKAKHQDCEVDPASFLVKNTVIVMEGFPHSLHLQIFFYILRCSE